MNAVADAAAVLSATLKAIPGVRRYEDPGAAIDPPATVLGPPALTYEAYNIGPTSARFLVYAIEKVDERSLERLWDLVERVGEAVDGVQDAVVIRADPGTYTAGTADLPCYEITVEVSI